MKKIFFSTILGLLFGGALCATPAQDNGEHRIARVWHGRVLNARAVEYAAYLSDAIKVFPSIKGNLGYQMLQETIAGETHFTVISFWVSREAIKAFAGDDIRRVHPLPRDPEFLIAPERTVMNYDLIVDRAALPTATGTAK